MAGPFAITVPSNTVLLDSQRQGRVAFTVSNLSGRKLRGRGSLDSPDASAASWLSIAGDAERDFAIAGTEQYEVQVAVPPTAPPGSYTIHLHMVGVDNPDELFSEGPTVAFTVAPQPIRKPVPLWMPVAALVALLALGIGGYVLANGPWQPTPPPVTVPPITIQPAELPDLQITNNSVTPVPSVSGGLAVLLRGTTYRITLEITNGGAGTVQGNVAVSIDYACQGPGVGESGASVVASGPMQPGAKRLTSPPYVFMIPATRPAGTCRFNGKVDPDDIYKESNENNNTWTTTVAIK